MIAKVTHGLKDFAQPFVVADVVADEECVTHVGSSFELNGHALRAMKKASLPCWLKLSSALNRLQIREYSAGKLPNPREVPAISNLATVFLIRVNGVRRDDSDASLLILNSRRRPHRPDKRDPVR